MVSPTPKHTNLKIEALLCHPIIDNGDKRKNGYNTSSNSDPDLPFFHLPLPPGTTATTPSFGVDDSLLSPTTIYHPSTHHSKSFSVTESVSPRTSSGILESCILPLSYNLTVKAKRKRASPWQTAALEQVFKQTEFPSSSIRAELGLRLGMTPRTIQIWFQNKRQAMKRSTTAAVATIRDVDFHAGSHIEYEDHNNRHQHLHYCRQQRHQRVYIATP